MPDPCRLCDGPPVLLGRLGSYNHYRCRNCGIEFSRLVEQDDEPQTEDDDELSPTE
jgi:hypothetical protein